MTAGDSDDKVGAFQLSAKIGQLKESGDKLPNNGDKSVFSGDRVVTALYIKINEN